jgi:argininosuccinate lyase
MEVLRKAFSQKLDAKVSEFVSCVDDDVALIDDDIKGSIAHSQMLGQAGLLTPEQAEAIKQGLQQLNRQFSEQQLTLKPEFEDVHMNVEKLLETLIGQDALRLHTARSRNDQVAFDLHSFTCKAIKRNIELLVALQRQLVELAKKHVEVVMPGYTHLQRAQPVLFSHVLLSYVWMFERDKARFADAYKRADVSPLGAGALSGSSLPIDPQLSASLAGFSGVFDNSIDAVSDRDFIAEFLSCSAITSIHASQLCETFVIWATSEFGFITFDDDVTTASSLMPNKKNPDPLEIARAKSGTICGDLFNVLMVLKSLPAGYNRDLQEAKPPLVNSAQTLQATLQVVIKVLGSTRVKADTMREAASDPFVIATDLVEYLVKKGVPFRTAHEQIGELFAYCRNTGSNPAMLSLAHLQSFAPQLGNDARDLFNAQASANAKVSHGGTAISQVTNQLTTWTCALAQSDGTPE